MSTRPIGRLQYGSASLTPIPRLGTPTKRIPGYSVLFGLLRPLTLAQPHARAAAVLVDEFDAGTL